MTRLVIEDENGITGTTLHQIRLPVLERWAKDGRFEAEMDDDFYRNLAKGFPGVVVNESHA